MSRILIRNAVVLPMDDRAEVISPGCVAIEGQDIIAVGPEPQGQWDTIIDASGMAALPGFVNAHTHAAMTLMRGYADDMPLLPWLQEKIWPLEAMLDKRDIYWGSLLAIAEMLRAGVTTFNDMYYYYNAVAHAVEESGIRACLSGVLLGFLKEAEQHLRWAIKFARAFKGRADGRIQTMLGPHAAYTCPDHLLQRVVEAALELGVGLHIHLSETAQEVEDSIRQHGESPVAHLERVGLFRARPVLAAHCVHVSDRDIEILARNGVGVSHNPGSNMKLASGTAPVPALLAAGVNVGLGTDGAASNNNLDILEEARLASLLHKLDRKDPTVLDAYQALRMATRGGAVALGLGDNIGQLKPGMKADVILIELRRPHLVPLHSVISQIAYSARADDVSTVIVNGRIVMRDRKLLTIDEQKVMAECSARAAQLASGTRPRRR
jgi:5-methylthioadenosine/S-adenosylhomocysteine deaminase